MHPQCIPHSTSESTLTGPVYLLHWSSAGDVGWRESRVYPKHDMAEAAAAALLDGHPSRHVVIYVVGFYGDPNAIHRDPKGGEA